MAVIKPSTNPSEGKPSSLARKVVVITGGNVGLGRQSAIRLAKKGPAEIWIASRNKVKGEEAVAEIQKLAEVDGSRPLVRFLELDPASFDSIKAAAQGVNHVGHALLFKLLLLRLLETTGRPGGDGDVRVISLSSIAHHVPVRGSIVWETLKSDGASLYPVQRYGQSKMANLVYAAEIARRYPQLTSVSVYPGIVGTDIFESGNAGVVLGLLHLYASVLGPRASMLGRIRSPSSRNLKLGKKLWEWIEKEFEGHGLG
ncbi:hypothetical protein RB596_001288 [Gaeumannomyces avenae]